MTRTSYAVIPHRVRVQSNDQSAPGSIGGSRRHMACPSLEDVDGPGASRPSRRSPAGRPDPAHADCPGIPGQGAEGRQFVQAEAEDPLDQDARKGVDEEEPQNELDRQPQQRCRIEGRHLTHIAIPAQEHITQGRRAGEWSRRASRRWADPRLESDARYPRGPGPNVGGSATRSAVPRSSRPTLQGRLRMAVTSCRV